VIHALRDSFCDPPELANKRESKRWRRAREDMMS
jgi:hypothetical protein